jgi:hypothetical protein
MVGSKLNHVIKVLPPPEDFSSAIHHMFANFIWNGRHWKYPHYVYAGVVDGGTGVKHLATRIVILRLPFLLQFRAEENRGHAWRFQAWNLLKYGPFQRPEDVLLVNLNEARIVTLAPFYVGALKAWATVNPRSLHSFKTVGELRVPLWDSVF